MHPYLDVLGHNVSMYWLSAIVGLTLATGFALVRRRAVRFQASAEDVFLIILCILIGALVGAKVFQLTGFVVRDGGNPGFWTLANWKGMMKGVGVFYGGLIGGLLAALIYARKYKLNFWNIADLLVPSVPLYHTIGRLVSCNF